MLCLQRKQGEKLVIGKDIIVTVNRIMGNRVSIGVTAPTETKVVRGELIVEADKESERAA